MTPSDRIPNDNRGSEIRGFTEIKSQACVKFDVFLPSTPVDALVPLREHAFNLAVVYKGNSIPRRSMEICWKIFVLIPRGGMWREFFSDAENPID